VGDEASCGDSIAVDSSLEFPWEGGLFEASRRRRRILVGWQQNAGATLNLASGYPTKEAPSMPHWPHGPLVRLIQYSLPAVRP
jgi:hypothetical protein